MSPVTSPAQSPVEAILPAIFFFGRDIHIRRVDLNSCRLAISSWAWSRIRLGFYVYHFSRVSLLKMSVLLETSAGDIVIDLLVEHAPKLCEKYASLSL